MQKTILIIDDSATIRRLVDRGLTAAGYRVIAAETAERGLELVDEEAPDLVLLDHQLPGTTGTAVCRQILEKPAAAQIPVVISSTLRKRAYAEYMEMPNVVDMLPKPYSEELLGTTIENALNTAAMVVESQSNGTAVPEVIQQLGEPDLAGVFANLGIREVLDFLNNTSRRGVLEVEGGGYRIFFFLDGGRIAGVSASGLDADRLAARLPDTLHNLAPILSLTLGGSTRGELTNLVELLNHQVVDPRLLRELLRCQAALLTWQSFTSELSTFRFTQNKDQPPLVEKLPLECSVLALLVAGALLCDEAALPPVADDEVFVRRALRGQNLDRAGVSAKQLKLLNLLAERRSLNQLANQLAWPVDEVRRVLHAFVLTELVECQVKSTARQILVYEPDGANAGRLRELLHADGQPYFGKVVRDRLAMNLVLKRAEPDAILFAITRSEGLELLCELHGSQLASLANTRWMAMLPQTVDQQKMLQHLDDRGLRLDAILPYPLQPENLFTALDDAFQQDPSDPVHEPVGQSETESGMAIAAGII